MLNQNLLKNKVSSKLMTSGKLHQEFSNFKRHQVTYSRSHNYAQLGNVLQKYWLFCFDKRYFKNPTARYLISVPKVKILQWARMDLICPNFPR